MKMLESILRWFRRPARLSGYALAQAIQDKIDAQIQAHRDWQLQNEREAAEAVSKSKPDLQLLLANGRAAAERQQQIIDPAPAEKRRPTKFTARCQWCLEPFDREPRSPGELEKLRQVLFITGPQAQVYIDICDTCYESVVGSAVPVNGHTGLLDIGISNSAPPNVALQRFHNPAA